MAEPTTASSARERAAKLVTIDPNDEASVLLDGATLIRAPHGQKEAEWIIGELRAALETALEAATADATRELRACLAQFVAKLESEDYDWPLYSAFEQGRLGHWDEQDLDWPEVLERLRDPEGGGSPHSDPNHSDYEAAALYRRAHALVEGDKPDMVMLEREALAAQLVDARQHVRHYEDENERLRDEIREWERHESYPLAQLRKRLASLDSVVDAARAFVAANLASDATLAQPGQDFPTVAADLDAMSEARKALVEAVQVLEKTDG